MIRRLRLLHVIKGLGRGGAEMLLRETHRALAERDFECHYAYFLPWKDALVPELRELGAEVTCLQSRTTAGVILRSRRLARLARLIGADVLHGHLPVSGVSTRIAGRIAALPVVYTEHNLQQRYRPATAWINARTWNRQRSVIAVSREVAESIYEHIGREVPVRVIRNGVDPGRYDPASMRAAPATGENERKVVIGTVAVFRKQKRLDLWIDAARRIHEVHPETRFVLVGDGPLHERVRAWVDAAGLRGVLALPGLATDVRPFLADMDLYMMSSDHEGLPVAMLEAMAMELPVVATAVGGIPEVLDEGVGRVVERRSVESLVKSACDLIAAPEQRRSLGRAARARVEDGFSVDRMADELAEVYRHAAGGCGV